MTYFKQRMPRAAHAALVVAALAVVLAAGACSDTSEASRQGLDVVEVEARDFAFDINEPDAVRPGTVELRLANTGKEAHQLSLGKLKDGVDEAAFNAALMGGGGNPLDLVEFVGGPNHVAPGQTETSYVELEEGQYVMICFIPSHDGAPHLVKGMTGSFTVKGGKRSGKAPQADADVVLSDYAITMPAKVDGDAVLAVKNAGKEAHELAVIELADGETYEQALRELHEDHASGNKPTSMPVAGGAAVVSPGEATLVKLNLDKGRYIAVCYVPDPQGKPHFDHGMAKEFSVK